MNKKNITAIIIILTITATSLLALFNVLTAHAQNQLYNGDFISDLFGWQNQNATWIANGAEIGNGGAVAVGDTDSFWQSVQLSAGTYYLSFHISNDLQTTPDTNDGSYVGLDIDNGDGTFDAWPDYINRRSAQTNTTCEPIDANFFHKCYFPFTVDSKMLVRIYLAHGQFDLFTIVNGTPPIIPTPNPTNTPTPTATSTPAITNTPAPTAIPITSSYYLEHPNSIDTSGSFYTGVRSAEDIERGFGVCEGNLYKGGYAPWYSWVKSTCDGLVISPAIGDVVVGGVWDVRAKGYWYGDGSNFHGGVSFRDNGDWERELIPKPLDWVTYRICSLGAWNNAANANCDVYSQHGGTEFINPHVWGGQSKGSNFLVEFLNYHYVIEGIPPPPPPPPKPPAGFGTLCNFTSVITDNQGITTTTTISTSASLLTGGGFNSINDIAIWSYIGGTNSILPAIVTGNPPPYEGERFIGIRHDQDDYTKNFLCQETTVPAGTDVLQFGGAFRTSTSLDPVTIAAGLGINQGLEYIILVDTESNTDWVYSTNFTNYGGQSVLNVCADFEGSSTSLGRTDIDSLFVYAYDRPEEQADTDFNNLTMNCPDPDSLPQIPPDAEPTVTPFPYATREYNPVGGEDDAIPPTTPIDHGQTCFEFIRTLSVYGDPKTFGFDICIQEYEFQLGLLGYNFSTKIIAYLGMISIVLAWFKTR